MHIGVPETSQYSNWSPTLAFWVICNTSVLPLPVPLVCPLSPFHKPCSIFAFPSLGPQIFLATDAVRESPPVSLKNMKENQCQQQQQQLCACLLTLSSVTQQEERLPLPLLLPSLQPTPLWPPDHCVILLSESALWNLPKGLFSQQSPRFTPVVGRRRAIPPF